MPSIEIETVKTEYSVEGSGRDVILLHGWRQNMEMMQLIQDHLKKDFKVYNLDFPGFGKSGEPPVAWGVPDYVVFLRKFIEHFHIENPILIGHSFGCRVAIRYASEYEVYKMVLTGAAGIKPPHKADYYLRTGLYKTAKKIVNLTGSKNLEEKMKKQFGSDDYKNATGIMRDTFVKVVNDDVSPILPNVKCPVLLVWGDKDEAVPLWMAHKMEKEMQDAGLAIFEGDDHFAYYHQSARFNRVLDAFFAKDKEK